MTTKRRGILFTAVVLASVAGTTVWWANQPKSVPAEAWHEFSPPDCGCSLDVPGPPMPLARLGVEGVVQFTRMYTWPPFGHDFDHRFRYLEFTEIASKRDLLTELYAAELRRAQDELKGVLVEKTEISLGVHAGKEFQVRSADKELVVERIYLVKTRPEHQIYLLVARGKGARRGHKDIARFFDSFRIDH